MYTIKSKTPFQENAIENWQKMHDSLSKVYAMKKKQHEFGREISMYKARVIEVMEKHKLGLMEAVIRLASLPEFKISPSLTMRLYAAGFEMYTSGSK